MDATGKSLQKHLKVYHWCSNIIRLGPHDSKYLFATTPKRRVLKYLSILLSYGDQTMASSILEMYPDRDELLVEAAYRGRFNSVVYLVSKGIWNFDSLVYAVEMNHLEIARYLIKNRLNNHGDISHELTAMKVPPQIMEYLLL